MPVLVELTARERGPEAETYLDWFHRSPGDIAVITGSLRGAASGARIYVPGRDLAVVRDRADQT